MNFELNRATIPHPDYVTIDFKFHQYPLPLHWDFRFVHTERLRLPKQHCKQSDSVSMVFTSSGIKHHMKFSLAVARRNSEKNAPPELHN